MHSISDLPEWMRGYIAGIVDGEGSIGLNIDTSSGRCDHCVPFITICNTHKVAMYMLYNKLGIGTIYDYVDRGNSLGKKTIYKIDVRSVIEVYGLLQAIKSYLLIKRGQADLLVEFCEKRLSKISSPDDNIRIHNEIKELNGRPKSELL